MTLDRHEAATRAMRPVARAELALSLGIVALGAFVALETAAIEVSPSYARIGPRVFPWVVAIGLCLLGAALAVQAWRGRWHAAANDGDGTAAVPPTSPARADWRAFLLIAVGVGLYIALVQPGGFVVASVVLFATVARAFGSRRPVRDTAVGLALAIAVYAGFNHGLDLELPAGILQGALP